MKKISNKKAVSLYVRILTALLVIFFFFGVVLLMLKPVSFYVLPFSLVIAVGFGFTLYACLKIKIFEYENSLQVISIKQSYFWKINTRQNPIEFPNNVLVDFSVNQGLLGTSLILVLRSRENKIKKLYCMIVGLNKRQVSELKRSLANSKTIA